ncbi:MULTISPECIES: tail assembly protein [Pseudomonas]|uniref:Tail assembly protein n=1 Tax=Pseudomonas juntendi TaxID=2666183 RepID=A0A7W2PW69_9PSED|nr:MULTISPECIES: tail assembly protein [Pseudomonas]MBA6063081.1 tail assembly protein [Pseudomonas juntendi]MBA6129446.1 tail assembly protein [Pseudomonas juntendi]PYC04822.1 tail assembly protein [Pseudomonas sp. MB-090624]WBM34312.1 tail assembly protein [Pseudomonas sp. NY11382]
MSDSAIHYTAMTTIKLSGSLAQKFGRTHRRQLDTGDIWEAFQALKATLVGFEDEIRRLDGLGLRFAVFRNRLNVGADSFDRGGVRELRIVPVIGGSKRGGLLQTVVGIALIAAATFATGGLGAAFAAGAGGWGVAAAVGASMAIGGVIQLLSPQAQGLSLSAAAENKPSYAFGSARNTTASGNPVPICIGDRRWGGAIISASIEAQDKA